MTLEQPTICCVEDGLAAERTKERYRVAFRLFLQHCQLSNPTPLLQENPRHLENRIIDLIRQSIKPEGQSIFLFVPSFTSLK